MKIKRIYFLLLICLIPVIIIAIQHFTIQEKADIRGEEYAGSEKCAKCHQDVYNSYLQTAHFHTSRPSSVHDIYSNAINTNNTFLYSNTSKAVIEKHGDSLYLANYENGQKVRAEHFDITFGGVKAETYLYWKGNRLFELPLSYFNSLQSWTNSPGYETRHPYFDRPIVQRCLECHTSYAEQLPITSLMNQEEAFNKKSLIYGIDCERCHGPAAKHVNFHTDNPGEKKPHYIASFQSLTRAQKLDACKECHGGGDNVYLESLFKFKIGDSLAKFTEPHFSHQDPNPVTLDVHGNQNGLLAASKCFLMSNMDCSSCHNVHVKEIQDLVAYSQKCMKCHNDANHNFCTMAPKLGETIKNNCIDCHMPEKPSNVISIAGAGGKKEVPYLVRTHHIAIYPEESKKILAFVNNSKR